MTHFQRFNWYDTPEYYDIIFNENTENEADFLQQVRQRHVLSKGMQVLEPACGTGRLVIALSNRGFQVCGFDANARMLSYARRRMPQSGRSALLKQMSFDDFSFGERRFDMAHCLVSSFKHISTEAEARRHLTLMADAIRPGGVYVIGIHLTDYIDRSYSLERWEATRDGINVVCNIKSGPANRVARTAEMRARFKVKELGQLQRLETSWTARTYGPRQLRSLINTEPRFELVACYDFDFDIDTTVALEGSRLDRVLILRRISTRRH